jgi:hypothetical protein
LKPLPISGAAFLFGRKMIPRLQKEIKAGIENIILIFLKNYI